MLKKIYIVIFVVLNIILILSGCSEKKIQEDIIDYNRPERNSLVFNMSDYENAGNISLLLKNKNDGYIVVKAISNKRLKLQVKFDKTIINYDIPNDGEETVYPLQMGSGKYDISIYEQVKDNRYVELYNKIIDVELKNEFSPFLMSHQLVKYNEDSKVVKLSDKLTENARTQSQIVDLIFDFVINNIDYDYEMASNVQSGYIPEPDEVIEKEKGICYDYSSLTAAMLRAQGIPTKLVMGYVTEQNIYHAWNMIYLKNGGWQYRKIIIDKNAWGRIDTTFESTNKDSILSKVFGNKSKYIDLYQY